MLPRRPTRGSRHLVPYARGQKPVILHADQQIEILDALELAKELKLKAVISGGSEAWKVADALKQGQGARPAGGTLTLPRHDHDPYDAPYANPAKLHAAGVTVAIRSQVGWLHATATAMRNLPFEAATAVAFGLARRGRPQGRDADARPRSSVSPIRSARSKPANAPTSSSPPATSSADHPRTGPIHRRRAASTRKPPYAALRQVPPPARRGPSRPGQAGNRDRADESVGSTRPGTHPGRKAVNSAAGDPVEPGAPGLRIPKHHAALVSPRSAKDDLRESRG